MFGFITANVPELKVKDYNRYRAYYCGICRGLSNSYGQLGRLTLTYDLTFLELLLTGLYEPETVTVRKRCLMHPFTLHEERTNAATEYASDMNLLLAWYQAQDDWQDERKWKKGLLAFLIRRRAKKAAAKYPEKAKVIADELDAIREVEKAGSTNLDEASGHFGRIMEEIFLWKKDEWERTLRQMGFYLGKFIYLADAYEDIDADIAGGQYNPFREMRQGGASAEEFDRQCEVILTMMLSQCTQAFELLPIIEETELLRNILYSGAWNRFEIAKKKRQEGNSTT